MNPTRIRTVARRLAATPPDPGPPASDAELLARFLDAHDEAAFEGIVTRHLPGVRAVCRSLLRNPADADDAVQATFLVLVRRAGAVRNRLALGAWLCRVAWRTANRLRGENLRRGRRHAAGLDPDSTPGRDAPPGAGEELAAVLEEEIRRLPECYRIAVLTCYAAETPTAEAAVRLGWPRGTLLTRLAWARRRLRDRLSKRGATLAAALAAAFAGRVGSAGGAVLAERITAAAVAVVMGLPLAKELVSERVSSLTEGVVRTMLGTKLKVALGVAFLTVALLGLGLGRMTAGPADAGDKKPLAVGSPQAKVAEAKPAAATPTVESESPKAEAAAVPDGPGNDLVVRRPLGSYTREVAPFGKVTLTFTENRIHAVANVRIENTSFTLTADADYSLNRESMVYGIINAVDVTGLAGDEAAEVAILASGANDLPFAFRIRADDDAVTIKDIRFGALGSPAFEMLFDEISGDKDSLLELTGMLSGKYKADPNPEKNTPLPAPRVNPPARIPGKKMSSGN